MRTAESIDILLREACASIQYRLRREILRQPLGDPALSNLQAAIEQDDLVRTVFSWQQPDGWLGRDFHGFESIEAGIRILAEKGLQREHPVLSEALHALEYGDDRLHLGIGKVGQILDHLGFGGSQRIRAAVFAYAGMEDRLFLKQAVTSALDSFRILLDVQTLAEVTEQFKGRLVFRPGVLWPDIYALRLLAFTHGWRNRENMAMVGSAVHRLVNLSPIPEIYIRYKSQWIAPGSFAMHDFNPDMSALDDGGWMRWFHRMEMLARLGLVWSDPNLQGQIAALKTILREGDGLFPLPLSHSSFNKWGAYSGLRLEKDWRSPKRRAYDLTFRSLLIRHYASSIPDNS